MARVTKVGVGYNVQLAVDTKHNLIAEQEVSNQVLDLELLAPTVTHYRPYDQVGSCAMVVARRRSWSQQGRVRFQ